MTLGRGPWELAGIGSMVVDSICRVPRLIGPDEKVLLDAEPGGGIVQRYVGGVMLNQLGWARVLGLHVVLFGKQADDADGAFLRAGMDRLGIEHALDLSGSVSSFARIYVDAEGRRGIYMARGATAELTPDEIDARHRPLIDASRVVSSEVSQVPLPVVRRVLERARAAGARTVVDLDVPLRDAVPALGSEGDLHAVLALADWLKPSLAATEGIAASREPARIAEELARRYGSQAVILTLGGDGALLQADGDTLVVPPPRVRVVDSTGAGDAFLGGLIAGRARGLGWLDAARLGNACGAACCERQGAFPEDPAACRARALELYRSLGGAELALPATAREAGPAGGEALEHFLDTALRELGRAAGGLERSSVARAVELILAAEAAGGRVHATGIGKSEYVARYAAALLASTGTPATFLHGTEATHGSVGQLRSGDVLIAISNSGETEELLATVRAARALGARIVSVCRALDSALAREAEVTLRARVEAEGGPLGLAPRSSVLAQLLVCAALSSALQEAQGFSREDYRLRHPAGELGRRARRED